MKDPFDETDDLIEALEDSPPTGEIPLPEGRLFALEATRREALAKKRGPRTVKRAPLRLFGAALAAALVVAAVLFFPSGNHSPVGETARIVLTSPGDVTDDSRPRIRWNSRDADGQKYDVWILPEEGDFLAAPALFVARSVTSPLSFDELSPRTALASLTSGNYRALVCLAGVGRHSGVPVPFRVESPSSSAETPTKEPSE